MTRLQTLGWCSLMFASSLTWSCKSKTPIPLDKEFLGYVSFNEGSYWIYIDSVANTLDSSYVTVNEIVVVNRQNPKQPYETIDHDYVLLNEHVTGGGWTEGNGDSRYDENSIFGTGWNHFFYPIRNDGSQLWYDSVVVRGKTYFDVIAVVKPVTAGSPQVVIYYAKHVGVIKRVVDGTVWELERYGLK